MHLSQQRCYHHAAREAAARCPQCGRFFCRECVAEYGRRFLCAECLAALTASGGRSRGSWGVPRAMLKLCVALLVLWGCFYATGLALMQTPSFFHDATGDFMGDGDE